MVLSEKIASQINPSTEFVKHRAPRAEPLRRASRKDSPLVARIVDMSEIVRQV